MFLSLLLGVTGASAACPSSAASLQSALDSAQLAFSMIDSEAFQAATTEAAAEAGCLADPVAPTVAARLHRVLGLRAFVSGDEAAARTAFASARAIEPDYQFPDTLVPADHPVRQLYTQAMFTSSATTPLSAPEAGHLEFDGSDSTMRPTARPTLALLVDPDGAVQRSAYLWPADPLFEYAPARAVASIPMSADLGRVGTRRGPNVPLTLVAAASLAAGGTCWGIARAAHNAYDAAANDETTLTTLQNRTNAFFVTSVGAGVIALGAGVGAVVAGHW